MMDTTDLAKLIGRSCPDGRLQTAWPRMTLINSQARTPPSPSLYQPLVCFVAQGAKRVVVGEREVRYDAGTFVVVSLDLPVCAEICEASPDAPYLAVSMHLDRTMLADILLGLPEDARPVGGAEALAVSRMTAEIVDPLLRLLRLLDHPEDVGMLAPLLERELLYRLLQGEQGHLLRQFVQADSRLSQVARAIAHIRAQYDRPVAIGTLADLAGMSQASFHRHFKAVTAMSPLQYQKHVRLHEARRLLLTEKVEAARAGFSVGYESPSQFSREYARLFGIPPARDAARLRALSPGDPHRAGELLEAQG